MKGDGDRMVMSCDTPVLQLTNIKSPVITWDYRTPKTLFWAMFMDNYYEDFTCDPDSFVFLYVFLWP